MIIRVAFATSDGKSVDRHFGAAERFDIYEINTEKQEYERVEIRSVEKACLNHKHHAERMDAVAGAIEDCHAVFAELSGAGARTVLESKNIQAIDIDRPISQVIENLLYGKIKLIDKRYTELPKKRQSPNFKKLQKKHPCMSGGANVTAGRIHLPVSPTCNIQCKFCTRRFDKSLIRPGVSSLVLKPEEAVETIERAKELCPELTVVGIAGPGDTLATNAALKTFALVKEKYPELINCLSTNGFCLPSKVEEIAKIGIETITVTVNAVDPEIEAKINEFVIDENGVKHEGVEGAKLLIENQLKGIKKAAELGIVVKINSVLCPGINDEHIEEVAKVTSKLGASILNIIPLIPQNGMADVPAPDCKLLDEVRLKAGKYIEVFRHCQHCRADALGIPGKGKDLHSELYKDRKEEVAETFSHG
ncbi:MAG: radical SAM protein [Lachnospiraceae bacterium]|nr:radical SAM protein [Lachnospiraceae bacterium]